MYTFVTACYGRWFAGPLDDGLELIALDRGEAVTTEKRTRANSKTKRDKTRQRPR